MAENESTEGKLGVLIVNLGTPDAPTPEAVKRYLAEFLSDRRVVDYPRLFWLPILYGIILNTRPAKTARNYRKIWRAGTNESPLRYFTRAQAAALAAKTGAPVEWAMRYGAPSVADGFRALAEKGPARILVIPLYPQYSVTTTASIKDAVASSASSLPSSVSINIAPAFFDDALYIDALAARAKESIAALGWTPERIVISFHGIPQRLVKAGDPYQRHCEATARLLREVMGWSEETAPLAYQSRFGPEKWLGPPTEETLLRLAGEGVKRVAVTTPGFVADCLETLEEIAITGGEKFLAAGGEKFAAIPCLNDSAGMTALLEAIAKRPA